MPLSRYLGAQMVRAVAYEHLQLKPFREGIYLNRDWGWCARITRGDLTATDQNDLLRTYPGIPSIRLVWRWVQVSANNSSSMVVLCENGRVF